MACRLVLIGMMGSGKSTVGRLLAQRTGLAYHDNDATLLAASGMTAREILAAEGDGSLQAAEARALVHALDQPTPCIVAAAAGVITDAASRERLTDAGFVVWLRATPETIHARAIGAAHRPWRDADEMRWIRETVEMRTPLYASVASIVLDADDATPAELAGAILQAAAATTPCAPWLTASRSRR